MIPVDVDQTLISILRLNAFFRQKIDDRTMFEIFKIHDFFDQKTQKNKRASLSQKASSVDDIIRDIMKTLSRATEPESSMFYYHSMLNLLRSDFLPTNETLISDEKMQHIREI